MLIYANSFIKGQVVFWFLTWFGAAVVACHPLMFHGEFSTSCHVATSRPIWLAISFLVILWRRLDGNWQFGGKFWLFRLISIQFSVVIQILVIFWGNLRWKLDEIANFGVTIPPFCWISIQILVVIPFLTTFKIISCQFLSNIWSFQHLTKHLTNFVNIWSIFGDFNPIFGSSASIDVIEQWPWNQTKINNRLLRGGTVSWKGAESGGRAALAPKWMKTAANQ